MRISPTGTATRSTSRPCRSTRRRMPRAALKRFRPVSFDKNRSSCPADFEARFSYAGHILGAAMIELTCSGRKILFSGDLGRPNDILLHGPATVEAADYVLVESTYGDRTHPTDDAAEALAKSSTRPQLGAAPCSFQRSPSVAPRNCSSISHQLKRAKRIPDLPIFLDSPMAIDASDIFCRYCQVPPDERSGHAIRLRGRAIRRDTGGVRNRST